MAKLFKNVSISTELIHLNAKLPSDNNHSVIIETTESKINDLEREERLSQAYQDGYLAATGSNQALMDQQITDLKNQLEALLLSLPEAVEQNRKSLSGEIADIILMIIQQYFIDKVSDVTALEQQIKKIISHLNNQQSIELHLHPSDISALQRNNIQFDSIYLNKLIVKGDTALSLGGCIVKTEHGIFDASIENQINKLKELLMQIRQRGLNVPLD